MHLSHLVVRRVRVIFETLSFRHLNAFNCCYVAIELHSIDEKDINHNLSHFDELFEVLLTLKPALPGDILKFLSRDLELHHFLEAIFKLEWMDSWFILVVEFILELIKIVVLVVVEHEYALEVHGGVS